MIGGITNKRWSIEMAIQINNEDDSILITLSSEGDVQEAVKYLLKQERDLWYIDVDTSDLMFQEMLISDLSSALLRKFGWIREIKEDLDKKKITLNILRGMLFDKFEMNGDGDDDDNESSGNYTGND
jgi:hypothetical protein